MMLVMMGCPFRRGACAWAWAGIRSENAGLSDKAENCSQKQNVFCHNDVRVMVEVGLLITFSAEAWPTTALLRAYRPTTAHSGTERGFRPHLGLPKAEAVVILSYLHTHLTLLNTSKKVKFRKNCIF
jgi:hypothetical protein